MTVGFFTDVDDDIEGRDDGDVADDDSCKVGLVGDEVDDGKVFEA